MSSALVYNLHGHEQIATALAATLGAEMGTLEQRDFPDGESYLRVHDDVAGRDVVILCGLEQPNPRFLPLSFLAATVREFGARRVGLVSPYLAYMRQDIRFHDGEALTSRCFARLISNQFDWLVTVDPHLHRYHALSDLYAIPSRVVHAADLMARFVADQADAFLVGPDEESEQWVSQMADAAGVPWVVARKERFGDRQVAIHLPPLAQLAGRHPVLMDDVISSGMTMARTLEALAAEGFKASTCVGVHGLFAEGADTMLEGLGTRLVCSNSIAQRSSQLDVGPLLAAAAAQLMA